MTEENFKILEAFMAGGNHIDLIRKVYNFSTLFLKRMDYVRDKAAKEDGDTDVNFEKTMKTSHVRKTVTGEVDTGIITMTVMMMTALK